MTAPLSPSFLDGGKILVVADDTPESENALLFACEVARKFGGAIVLLRVYRRPSVVGHWVGVRRLMEEDAKEHAALALNSLTERARALSGKPCTRLALPGPKVAAVREALTQNPDVRLLALAAAARARRPGPLVAAAGKGVFAAPALIVPTRS